MVLSFLTFYVIAFSCFTLVVGKTFAEAPVPLDVSPKQTFKRENKINSGEKSSKSEREIKVLQSSYLPAKVLKWKSLSNESIRTLNESHSYFALFDTANNVTRKLYPAGEEFSRKGRWEKVHRQHPWKREKIRNFVVWDVLEDAEKEMRVHINGITAKETVIVTGVDRETGKKQGLKLRQLTDGHRFIQLIYNLDDQIQDCEYLKEKNVVEKFLKTFVKDVERAKSTYETETETVKERGKVSAENFNQGDEPDNEDYLEEDEGGIERFPWHENSDDRDDVEEDEMESFGVGYRNVTFQIVRKDEDLPGELREWMNYSILKEKCRENHRILKALAYGKSHGNDREKTMAEEHIERVKRSFGFSLTYPGTKWCGKGSSAGSYTDVGRYFRSDKCCRSHDYCHPLIEAFESDFGYFNFRPFTISHCQCDSRRKRDIMDVLLVPGTKWCGKGRRATKYTSLGGFTRTDKCCRVHDTMCPHWIGSMEEKYGLFNWRINTIMHCRCDKRFRACLKMAKTGTANFVGKLFFNIVQTKCFVLKPKEVCVKFSWWGKCEKKEYRKQAYLKDNLSY